MKISVVIPAKNEEKYIERCLKALERQTKKPFEIIVIDGHSEDNTRIIAKKYAKVVLDRKRGISDARNQGAELSKGDIVAYTDADSEPPKDWLKKIEKNMDGYIAISGPISPVGGGRRERITLKLWTGGVYRIAGRMNYPLFCGPNMAFKRMELLKHKFRTDINVIEDYELGNRMRKYGRTKYIKDMVVYVSPRRYGRGFHRMAFRLYLLNFFRLKFGRKVKTGKYWEPRE